MKLIMQSAVLAAALTLAACGGGGSEANGTATENLALDNAMASDPTAMNGAVGVDVNAMMDANASANASDTANAVAADMNTNDPDTNLANGM